jgi:nicotinamide riboside transporter PnuC
MIGQIIIAICGVTAIWLANDTDPRRRRFACLFGLAAQPAWFYVTWTAGQYGIFALSLLYTWSWYRGFRRDWMK